MDISVPFFKKYAHSSYYDGLNKTGITFDKIPSINKMNEKMSKIGWGAVPVRGFIPPWAFMEFQSLGILPIACDMRSRHHLTYTPAPDIMHESSGHSPIIINDEYSQYLKQYGKIASKAVFTKEDENIYFAIRKLSDLKEDKNASEKDILIAEQELLEAKQSQTTPSEATLLSRLHWWTVEYGLIGKLNDPKIYGAGLLSSAGESQNCLSDKVKKIPLTIDCINYSYDITEQQPQLFVTNDFSSLNDILFEFEKTMSYKNEDFIDDRNHIKDSKNKITKLNTLNDGLDETKIIELYEMFFNKEINEEQLKEILDLNFPNEWLLRFELYRNNHHLKNSWVEDLRIYLKNYNKDNTDLNKAINRGLELI